MRSRLIRLLLVAVLVAAAAGAAYVVHDVHTEIGRIAAAGRIAEQHASRLEFLATELRNTIAASEGTVPSKASLSRATGLIRRLRTEADRLAGLPAPVQALESTAAVQDTGATVATALERAAGYVDEGADLMAGDVLANDAGRGVVALADAVTKLRLQQAQAVTSATAPLTERTVIVSGSAAAFVLLGLIVLATTAARPKQAPAAMPDASETAASAASSGLGLVAPIAATAHRADPPAESAALGRLADLCRDVAAATSPSDLPRLLERTASLLGANGVILWAVSDGHLVPVAAHGYTASALRAMGHVPMTEGTPLGDACHSFQASAVAAGDGAPDALIVPLGSPGDCHGILTAECRQAGGFKGDALATARIAGSQFEAEFLSFSDVTLDRGQSEPAADLPLDAASA
jgi:hypothetical protein